METLSTDPLGDIIHKTESEFHPVILVFKKDSSSISVKALRKSSLLEVWITVFRVNLGIAQWRAILLPLASLDRVVPDCSEIRPQKSLTPISRELLRDAAQLFGSHLSYTSHCIAATPLPDHEPQCSKFGPWSVHCIPGLTCSSSLQICFVIPAQCLRLDPTARPNFPHLGAGGPGSYCPAACVGVLCSWLPLTCGTVDFHCFLTISPGIRLSFRIASTAR